MDYAATGAAKAEDSPQASYTPINIRTVNGTLQVNPAEGTSSKSTKSGLQFNTDQAYTLTWTPSCPVQGANSSNQLALGNGANQDFDWVSGLGTGQYDYTVNANLADSSVQPPPVDGPFDVNIES